MCKCSEADEREPLDTYLQCLLLLGTYAKQSPSDVKQAFLDIKPSFSDLIAHCETNTKKKVTSLITRFREWHS